MLQRPHFLPKVKPRSVAQTAHCVRIILYVVKSLGGSPAMQKPLSLSSSWFASVLQPLAARGQINHPPLSVFSRHWRRLATAAPVAAPIAAAARPNPKTKGAIAAPSKKNKGSH